MSQTQDSIGIKPSHNAQPAKDGGANATNYNNDLRGQRRSSKSATYPFTADTAVNASKVKRSGVKPID
jgi:hypothetical protein